MNFVGNLLSNELYLFANILTKTQKQKDLFIRSRERISNYSLSSPSLTLWEPLSPLHQPWVPFFTSHIWWGYEDSSINGSGIWGGDSGGGDCGEVCVLRKGNGKKVNIRGGYRVKKKAVQISIGMMYVIFHIEIGVCDWGHLQNTHSRDCWGRHTGASKVVIQKLIWGVFFLLFP